MANFRVACLFLILFGVFQDSHRYVGAATVCNGHFNSSTGLITSINYPGVYPANIICTWVIDEPNQQPIGLYVNSFLLEGGTNCPFDYLEIRNGSSEAAPLVGKYCGSTIPLNLTSFGHQIYLKFRTDGSNQYSGISIAWSSATAGSGTYGGHFDSSHGVITSPNYPSYYPANFEAEWIIDAPAHHQVTLNVTKFDTLTSTGCASEYLEIRSGSASPGRNDSSVAGSTLLGKYCGSNIPTKITSNGTRVFLRFKSAYGSNNREGFVIEWDSTSIVNCGSNLTSSQGTISSPFYPELMNSAVTCDWNIRVSAGSVIQFLLVDLEFEEAENCTDDFVEIYDGSNRGGRSLGTHCQSINHPLYIETTSNVASVRFRSDSARNGRRFQILYHTICYNQLHGPKGVIESPNFPNQYPHRENCTWIIQAPTGTNLNLRISDLDLEGGVGNSCDKDYLEIREGENYRTDRVIGKFCNTTSPPSVIVSTGRQVFVQFHSDNSGSGNGFRLEWLAAVHNTIQPPSPSCLIWNDPVPQRADYTYTPGIGGHKLHTRAVPWNEARLTCEEEGGYLAIINSDAELNAIIELFGSNSEAITGSQSPNLTTIGFHDLYKEGQFVTIHGQPLDRTGFFQWEYGQLDNDERSENCGALSISGELNEVSCENNYAFVCEVPMY